MFIKLKGPQRKKKQVKLSKPVTKGVKKKKAGYIRYKNTL